MVDEQVAPARGEADQVLRVQAEDVDVVVDLALGVLEGMVLPVRDLLVGDRPVGDAGLTKRGVQPARDLALAELGLEEADEVDAGRDQPRGSAEGGATPTAARARIGSSSRPRTTTGACG